MLLCSYVRMILCFYAPQHVKESVKERAEEMKTVECDNNRPKLLSAETRWLVYIRYAHCCCGLGAAQLEASVTHMADGR